MKRRARTNEGPTRKSTRKVSIAGSCVGLNENMVCDEWVREGAEGSNELGDDVPKTNLHEIEDV